jgi:transcription initiation factor TFIID TATA-box-binding protein
VAQTARNAEYNPARFQAAIMRIREPRTTALVFSNGKMIVTGAKRREVAEQACAKFKNILGRIGFPVSLNDFTIHNITATFDTGFPIRLEGLIHSYSANASYEPELFPGLVYRMTDPKVVLLIFVSGKVVITGAKSVDAIQIAVDSIWEILCEFRKKNIVVTPVDR